MRILLIDDNPGRAAILVQGLRGAGHEVGHAATADLGAVLAERLRPEVVFASARAPGALRPLQSARCLSQARLVGLVDEGDAQAARAAEEAGLHAVLALPLDPTALVPQLLSRAAAPRG